MNLHSFGLLFLWIIFLYGCSASLQNNEVVNAPADSSEVVKIDGYKGIWFTLNQFYEYGDKYSGGLGTYTAKHVPLSIYAPEVNKTFFVYGGTTGEKDRYLLCMIGSYDHENNTVSRPAVVHDKEGVDDPHDNSSLSIDEEGYLWVFVSGRGTSRPGFKYRSASPYSIESFEQVSEEEMTYPQPWYVAGKGFLHLFTKYSGVRELYYESSPDGIKWTGDRKLSGIKEGEDEKGGHYQMSNRLGDKIVTFFNWHPNGNVDRRTNLYYLQTTDLGETWTDIEGNMMQLPLTQLNNAARVRDYYSQEKNVYLKDVNFDTDGNPIGLYITSGGHEPGPSNDPREWHVIRWNGSAWEDHVVGTSDHNYDMGSLFIDKGEWIVVAPTENSPQPYGGGGEVVIWKSNDEGNSWNKVKQVTRLSERNHNYVRRVVNGKDPFLYFWADGNPDSLSISRMYYGDSQGNYWRLPYEMKNGEEPADKMN
ncbi:BNR-4 repeat-containing protein [Catalinimonas alkaloidigena]|uniref:BNR-4 repeat-containing protein n=1 Tax=Catalinimonas alkaloidigena TaxID=1075417 RepID=UPI0024049316|nr:BNR-4 repeat-containing protein [Catalinimonas alkaloidigena]